MYEDDGLGLWISTLNTRCRKEVQRSCDKAEVLTMTPMCAFENGDYYTVTRTLLYIMDE